MNNQNFDERQQIERGKAFQWAFGATLLLLLVYFLIDEIFELCEFSMFFIFFTSFWVSFAVFSTKAVLKDALYGINGRASRYCFAVLGILGIFMLVVYSIEMFQNKALLVDNKLNDSIASIIQSISMIEIFIISETKQIIDKHKNAEE